MSFVFFPMAWNSSKDGFMKKKLNKSDVNVAFSKPKCDIFCNFMTLKPSTMNLYYVFEIWTLSVL